MARWAGLRLTLNLIVLAASLLWIIGAVWAVVGGLPATTSGLARCYAPVARAWAVYHRLGVADKFIILVAALVGLAALLWLFLYTFRWRVEEWAVVILGGPTYLLIALVIVLASNLLFSVIRLVLVLSPGPWLALSG